MARTRTAEQPSITFELFLDLPDFENYELVEGRLVQRKHVGVYANFVAAQIAAVLSSYCRGHRAGAVFASKALYRCFGFPHTACTAALTFVRTGRLTEHHIRALFFTLVPDLVVELTSPDDLAYDLEAKLSKYQRVGVPVVWVVHPGTRRVTIRRADRKCVELNENGEIKDEPMLPGFSCKVRDFFPPFPAA